MKYRKVVICVNMRSHRRFSRRNECAIARDSTFLAKGIFVLVRISYRVIEDQITVALHFTKRSLEITVVQFLLFFYSPILSMLAFGP